MLINWDKKAKKSFEFLRQKDKRIFTKVLKLLDSIEEQYNYGIGKPERLKGYKERILYSRHIDEKNRLIYEVLQSDDEQLTSITILSLIGHYDDK